MVQLELEQSEAKELASLLTALTGRLQYRAVHNPELDKSWPFWHKLSQKVSNALGFEAYMVTSRLTDAVLSVELQSQS